MSDLETSLTEQEYIEEVRDALAGIDSAKIPDDTILQARDRVVVPLLNDLKSFESSDQTAFDNAAIMWGAELSFDAWMTFTRLRDREIEAYVDPNGYKEQLEARTKRVLGVLDITKPAENPQTVISVQHDGVKRKVDLSQEWETV